MERTANALVKFLVVTNAGGAIAVLGFMGAAYGKGDFPKLGVLALSLFVLGLLAAGAMLYLHYRWFSEGSLKQNDDADAELERRAKRVKRAARMEQFGVDWLLPGSFCFFCVGAALGIVMLLML